ncbi:hypothetical protein LTR53_005170 [Teratosphaeriaceae sp. CCFEE 6253]|nr:hypothetical protein LTR53_005170 [Teratosphaeriaceae sp. CCFEE 6253]
MAVRECHHTTIGQASAPISIIPQQAHKHTSIISGGPPWHINVDLPIRATDSGSISSNASKSFAAALQKVEEGSMLEAWLRHGSDVSFHEKLFARAQGDEERSYASQ